MCCLWFQDFLTQTRKNYSAELESVDFIGSTEAARLNINNWVEKNTQGDANINTYTFVNRAACPLHLVQL